MVALDALEQPDSARYLSSQEGERIADVRFHGISMQAIGRELDRSMGAMSREIKRNSHPVLVTCLMAPTWLPPCPCTAQDQ